MYSTVFLRHHLAPLGSDVCHSHEIPSYLTWFDEKTRATLYLEHLWSCRAVWSPVISQFLALSDVGCLDLVNCVNCEWGLLGTSRDAAGCWSPAASLRYAVAGRFGRYNLSLLYTFYKPIMIARDLLKTEFRSTQDHLYITWDCGRV